MIGDPTNTYPEYHHAIGPSKPPAHEQISQGEEILVNMLNPSSAKYIGAIVAATVPLPSSS